MPAKVKVGSWLASNGSASGGPGPNEAYESGSSSSSDSGSDRGDADDNGVLHAEQKKVYDDDEGDDEVVEEDNNLERVVNVDWDIVMPQIRPALSDPSRKKREAFATRYLYVTDDCEYTYKGFITNGSTPTFDDSDTHLRPSIHMHPLDRFQSDRSSDLDPGQIGHSG